MPPKWLLNYGGCKAVFPFVIWGKKKRVTSKCFLCTYSYHLPLFHVLVWGTKYWRPFWGLFLGKNASLCSQGHRLLQRVLDKCQCVFRPPWKEKVTVWTWPLHLMSALRQRIFTCSNYRGPGWRVSIHKRAILLFCNVLLKVYLILPWILYDVFLELKKAPFPSCRRGGFFQSLSVRAQVVFLKVNEDSGILPQLS